MNILALDTSCGACSVAIAKDDVVLSHVVQLQENKQAESLVLMIEEALHLSKIGYYQDLDLIGITNGPGSFTGIRTGFAVLYGIHAALNIRCIGFTTLEILAHQLLHFISEDTFYITVAAGRERYYSQLFDKKLQSLSNIALQTREEISRLDCAIYGDYINKTHINSKIIATLAFHTASTQKEFSTPKPIYSALETSNLSS